MPAKDIYHDTFRKALEKDDWIITDDPLKLTWGKRDFFVDIGAKKLIAAQKGELKIAVEIKSFAGISQATELEKALGQYILYRNILEEKEPERLLYLAITKSTFNDIFSEPIGDLVIHKNQIKLMIVDAKKEIIIKWIN
ncbi:MAG: XisH family protein [Sphaerospermopsis sp.]|uniref:XisH family protein n=1 Tax=Sphaerospermopsis aphanizomenoides LEGE 00250 TaxID=2777972 RepID=A0ABR9VAS4_9CYAN|nr:MULTISPECIES: XisH family protein [Sphaerospermopsis]MBC5793876.1 XisH family protein [Sphaerospermopsis sp. LEGE 00249]MBE9234540.1 XisH family protein [Sphaerospermopsis aphanizomenoides LEGE 00250]MEB3149847.1 XisH family protein [Sphaerospermopsis sp.]